MRGPARELGVGALLASAGLIVSFAALGLNSIAVSRIEGPDGAGLVALSTQVVVIASLIAGIGMRTSVAYRVSAGLWSPRSAAHGALRASAVLGLVGASARLRGLPAAARLRDERLQCSDGGQPDGRPAIRAGLVDRARGPARLRALRAVRAAHRGGPPGGAGHLSGRRAPRGLNRDRDRLRRGLRGWGRGERRLGAPIRPRRGCRSRAGARGAQGRRLRPPRLGQRPVSVHQRTPGSVHPQRLLRGRRNRRLRGHDLDHVAGLDPLSAPGVGRPATDGKPRDRERGRATDGERASPRFPPCATPSWSASWPQWQWSRCSRWRRSSGVPVSGASPSSA